MNDNQIQLGSSALCFLLIMVAFKFGKKLAFINLIVFLLYSLPLYYNLYYNSKEGTALAWWGYLIALTIIHILIVGGYLIFKLVKRQK
jgi:hypothetical protein